MTFTETFLKAKHWQLFILTFGIPMVFQIILMISMFATLLSGDTSAPSSLFFFFKLFPVLMILLIGTIYGWFWSIAIGLQDKVPLHVKMKTKKFKIFFFIPLAYLLAISIGMGIAMTGLLGTIKAGSQPDIALFGGMVALIVPLHVFSVFCIFYCLYFVAKTFKTVERQRETTFSDFAGEFFMIWFYPIGIWIIQPKVNKMAETVSSISLER